MRLLRNRIVGQCRRDGMGNPSATDLVCVAETVSRPKALLHSACEVGKILLCRFVADGIERDARDELHNLDPVPIDVEEALMSPDVSKGDAAGQSDQAGSLALVLIRKWAGDGVGLGLAEGRFVDEVQDAMSHGQGFGFV